VGALVWFLYAQLTAHGFDWRLAGRSFEQLQWSWLLLSVVPIGATYGVRALRWAVFLKPVKERPSLRGLLSATVIGFAAISLFGRPGEFVRPCLIAMKERVPTTSQLATWLLERIFDLLMALLVFAFALSRIRVSDVQMGPGLTWILATGGRIVALLCTAVLVTLALFRHFSEPVRRKLLAALHWVPARQFHRIDELMDAFVRGIGSTQSDTALAEIILYSILEWTLVAGCYWCVAQSYSGLFHMSFMDVLIFMGFVSFGAAVQLPGIGGGVQVVSVVVLTELFNVRLEVATSFALLIWVLTFVAVIPFGLVLALKEGLDWHSLRQLSRQTSAS
jgi:glycosyltransferase 2 family protein